MTRSTRDELIRDALFEHGLFDAEGYGVLCPLEMIREVEATWAFEPPELEAELARMVDDGLLDGTYGNTWSATMKGRIARESRWQERGKRHYALAEQSATPEDLVLALVASASNTNDVLTGNGFVEAALSVYLFRLADGRPDTAVNALLENGLIHRLYPDGMHWHTTLTLTADGRKLYAQELVPRLGLRPPKTILEPLVQEEPRFADLGLDQTLAENLLFRWEEAHRCVGARAWLAAAALFGSILEVVLPDRLQREKARALSSKKAPPGLSFERWSLQHHIAVAVDMQLIDASLARHVDALRESRNLIHPDKHLRERSKPDGHLAMISEHVVRGVLASLAASTTSEAGE